MAELSSNPYASPTSPPEVSGRRRPIGTVLLAIPLLLYGIGLTGGGTIQFVEHWRKGEVPSPTGGAGLAHLGLLAIAMVVAAVGLFSGRRWGWWAALAFFYFGFMSFVIFTIIRDGLDQQDPFKKAVIAAIFVLYWFYLRKATVLAYFDQVGLGRWRLHICLLVLSAIVTFGLRFTASPPSWL